MKNKYKYFISYKWYSKKEEGFGNAIFTTKREMDYDLISEIEKELNKQDRVDKSIIINYIKM